MIKTPIYLDNQATTPLDPRVLDAMMPYLKEHFGNPHSSTHSFGWRAAAALDIAREQVAGLIGGPPEEVFFTSGATEANNMVIKGVMAQRGAERPKIICVATEHKCVLEAARYCQQAGYELEILPVSEVGFLDLSMLEAAVDDRTALVSIMAINNEIGVIHPLKVVGEIVKASGALFHTDAAQAFGKIPLDVEACQLDFVSISAHKIYGPKGVGALYKRAGDSRSLSPLFSGGGQEQGVRAGTQPPALVAGLGAAAEIAGAELDGEAVRTKQMMTSFKEKLFSALPELILNGDAEERWAGNLNISFPGLDGDLLLANTRDIAVSSGAACASAVSGPSYVLKAIGCTDRRAKSALRIGMGRFTTKEELDYAAEHIIAAVDGMGGLKP